MRIIIADDSTIMRKVIKKALEQTVYAGAETLEAGDGQEALEIFKSQDVDAVLCDWNMPHLDGLQFVVEARKINKNKYVPIIMVTTEGTIGKIDKAIKMGADRYITKPFSSVELEKSLNYFQLKEAA